MRSVKILSCVAAMALVALIAIVAAPVAEAQCGTPRAFASIGQNKAGYGQISVNPAPVTPLGDELGRFWDSDNSGTMNNFAGTCASPNWWVAATAAPHTGNHALNGALTGGACLQSGCGAAAGSEMTVLVEDWAVGFPPPGIGGDAYFIVFRVDDTPALSRWYDFGRTAAPNTIFPFIQFPTPIVTSSGRNGMNVEVNLNYADLGPNFHGANGGAVTPGAVGNPLPPQGTILSYDLMLRVGLSDPGRDRTLWTQIDSIPYPGNGVTGEFNSVACPDTINDAFLAVGVSFSGGSAGPVASRLVGKALPLECDPNLADPQLNDARPKVKQTETRKQAGRR